MKTQPAIYGQDLFGDAIQPPTRGILADRFTIPPFTVLNAREGFWQDRKRAWIGLGIQSEIGRGMTRPHGKDERPGRDSSEEYEGGDCWAAFQRKPTTNTNALGLSKSAEDYRTRKGEYAEKICPGGSPRTGADYRNKERGDGAGRPLSASSFNVGGWMEDKADGTRGNENGTSIFDPVLTELLYQWFCPSGGQIVDPFAGGSVRGIVAAVLGRKYWGCDLSANQIAANKIQAEKITPDAQPEWIVGDASEKLTDAPDADFIIGCPPYGSLEVYSDDQRDLSAMPDADFDAAYADIIKAACMKLKPNRFAAFVVGEYRDKAGHYRRFVPNTIQAFVAAGLAFYNEAILVTAVGSLPIRVTGQFKASRKLGKTHQNVLVFVKGDGFKAAKECGNEDA